MMHTFPAIRLTGTADRRGLSLVEVVMVVLILGILAGVAAPMYVHALARGRADAAARRIVVDLAMVQREAEVSSSSRTLRFYPAQHRYVAVGVNDFDRPTEDYTVRLQTAPYQCELVSVDLGGDEQITFDGFGLPDSDGTIVVQSGHLQRKVVVDATTGKGEIQP